jgi:hypothetical protein
MGALLLTLGSIGCMFLCDRNNRKRNNKARNRIALAEAKEEALKEAAEAKKEAEEEEAKILSKLQNKVSKKGAALYQAIKLDHELSDKSQTLIQMFNDRMPPTVEKFKTKYGRLPNILDRKRVPVRDLVFIEALSKCLGGGKKQKNSNASLV